MYNSMLFQELREFTTGLLNQLFVNLAGQDGQIWLDEFKKFVRQEACWVADGTQNATKKAKEVKEYLRRLFVFKLGASTGTDTYATAKEVFKAGFDADFEN